MIRQLVKPLLSLTYTAVNPAIIAPVINMPTFSQKFYFATGNQTKGTQNKDHHAK